MKYGWLASALVQAVDEYTVTYVFKVDESVANTVKVRSRTHEAIMAGKKSLLAIICEI